MVSPFGGGGRFRWLLRDGERAIGDSTEEGLGFFFWNPVIVEHFENVLKS